MATDLATRRDEVIAASKKLRQTKKTGFHDADPGSPQSCACPEGDQGVHLPNCTREVPIDEHLVAFKGRFETAFAGVCASDAHAAIKEYASENSAALTSPYIDHEERRKIDTAVEYAAMSPTAGNLVIRNSQWNDVLAILHAKGHAVSLTA